MIDRQFVPTLVVGLGGVGSAVVADVYARLLRQVRRIPEHVVFHVLDTDTNSLNGLSGLGDSEETFTQLGGGQIHRVSDFKRVFPRTEEWFPYGRVVNTKDTRNGAGQIRSISRLTTLELFTRPGANAGLARAVGRLRAIQERGNKNIMPRIIVVCSLAGGTGSGSFIQIALHLRELVAGRTQDSADSVTVRGFFLLPDAMIMEGQGNIATAQHVPMRANALACIKEIEAIRAYASGSISSPVQLEYSVGGRMLPVEVNPYDAVYLFDLENMRGEGLTQQSHYVELMSHALHLSLFSPMGDKQLSKEDNRIRDLLDSDGKNIYGSAAVAEVRYPLHEIAEFLARKWASLEIGSTWLAPDNRIEEMEASYNRDLAQGIISPPLDYPAIYRTFIEEQFASELGIQSFKRIRQQLYVLNKEGKVLGTKAKEWLESVEGYVQQQALKNLGDFEGSSFPSSADPDEGMSVIRSIETALRQRRRMADDVVKTLPNSLAAQIMIRDGEAPTLARGTEKHRLLYWIFDEMHPVAIRAFLYEARSILEAQLVEFRENARDLRNRIDDYKDRYDDPATTNQVETLEQRMAKIESANRFRRGREYRRLVQEHNQHSEEQRRGIDEYVVARVMEIAAERMTTLLTSFIEEWQALFFDLRLRLLSLDAQIQSLQTMHESHSNRTVRFVFASAAVKEELWRQLNATQRQSDAKEAQKRGIEAVYRGFVRRHTGGQAPNSKEAAGGFVDAMLHTFTEAVLPRDGAGAQNVLPRNIVEAMERHALSVGRSAKDVVLEYLEDLWPRAVPFIQVTRGTEGQVFNFWGVNAGLKDRLEPILSSTLRNRGEFSYDDTFSEMEILYYNVHAGFLASELAKFVPGYQAVGDRRPNGPYFDAYDKLRNENRVRKANSDKDQQEPLGSHLDKRWTDEQPLPEFWSGVILERVDRALIRGLLTGLLRVDGDKWVVSRGTVALRSAFDDYAEPQAVHRFAVASPGVLNRIRTQIEHRFDLMTEIEKHYEAQLRLDLERNRVNLDDHQVIKMIRSVPQSGWDAANGLQVDYNILALITELAHGTPSFDRIAEMRMERVYKLACEEIGQYVALMTGSRQEARSAALELLGSLEHDQAFRIRGIADDRHLLVNRLDAIRKFESVEE
jgi:hypothetical protein